jgi:Tfp pilus assembly protein PilF
MKLKRIIFWSLGVFVFSLILTEGFLRLFSTNNQLFIENNGLLTLNKAYFNRYSNIQCLPSVPFKKEKDKNTLRIFILDYADNTTIPHNPNSSFSHILNNLLQRSFSKKSFEVINVSVNTANSFVQRNVAKQLKKYNADLVLICPGHSEFIDPLTSVLNCQTNWLNRLAYETKHSFIFQAVGNFKKTNFNNIDTNSQAFANIVSNFETNLDQTVLDLQENNIKVVLVNSANNLLDICPERSCFTSPDSIHLEALFRTGKEAFESSQFDLAYKSFTEIYKKDKAHAATCFYLGRLALQNGDDKNAKLLLKKAVEHDKIKSRVPSKINDIIFKIATVRACNLIDVENLFSRYSEDGIPGHNLFLGSQQPNISGNMLIALECYKTLIADKFVQPEKSVQPSGYNIAFTPFDTLYDSLCSEYSAQSISYIRQGRASDVEEKMASLFMDNKSEWEDSMNALYEFYISQKNYNMAFKVIENLALENPYDISVNKKAAQMASLLGDSQLVIHYANKVFNNMPGYEAAQQLFLNYLKLDMPENALPYLAYARFTLHKASELRLIYSATCEVIDLKKLLKNNPADKAIKAQIAQQYRLMGNDEIAMLYSSESSTVGI